jgi:hypothetical protein
VLARRDDYPLLLALRPAPWLRELERGRLAYLDRRMVEAHADRAVRVRLSHEGGEFVCAREGPGAEWRLVEPVSGLPDRPRLAAVLARFSSLRAERVVAEQAADLAQWALAEPNAVAEVSYLPEDQTGPPGRLRLLLGGRAPGGGGVFAGLEGEPRVFILAGEAAEELRVGLASRLISEAEELREIEFSRGERSVSFIFRPRLRVWLDSTGGPVDREVRRDLRRAARLLAEFRALEVVSCIPRDGGQYGLRPPALRVRFSTGTTSGKTILLGARTAGGRYVRGPLTGFVHLASEEDCRVLLGFARLLEDPAN